MKYYCDASFNPQHKIAVIAWKSNDNDDNNIHYKILYDTTNTGAEIEALVEILNEIYNSNLRENVIIFTDCQSAINRINARIKLIESNFISKKGTRNRNADRYIKIFKLIDSIDADIEFKHIKGHVPAGQMNDDNKIFSSIDKFARKQLRVIITNM